MILQTILRDLRQADDFRNNWYGWFTNQVAHCKVGLTYVLIVCLVWTYYFNEFPYKVYLFSGIAVVYLLWEFAIQRGKDIVDSLEDFCFVVLYGAGFAVTAFTEKEAGSPELSFNSQASLGILIIYIVHLSYGVTTRSVKAILDGRQ